MNNSRNSSYDFVDICKFIACIFVVCIHTSAFSEYMGDKFYYLLSCVYRLAVLFFFIASAFFFGKKLLKEGGICRYS